MDVSIIIVSWNAKKHLVSCLASLVNELAPADREIIVVDNCSTDGSQEEVRTRFPDVRLICNDSNLGFAKANNIGIRDARGRYICLINSDVVAAQGCLHAMRQYMEARPEIGLLGPRIVGPDGKLQRSCMGFPSVWRSVSRAMALDCVFPSSKFFSGWLLQYFLHDTISSVDIINGCFWMVRREALNEVGLLDEQFFMYAEDMDWCRRFKNAGWDVVFYPHASVLHYGGASSANAPLRFYIETLRANLQYWRKHQGPAQTAAYRLTLILHHLIRLSAQGTLYFLNPTTRELSQAKLSKNRAALKWLIHPK